MRVLFVNNSKVERNDGVRKEISRSRQREKGIVTKEEEDFGATIH